jgi:formylglycine-generating enzyme required for sulfatase activity
LEEDAMASTGQPSRKPRSGAVTVTGILVTGLAAVWSAVALVVALERSSPRSSVEAEGLVIVLIVLLCGATGLSMVFRWPGWRYFGGVLALVLVFLGFGAGLQGLRNAAYGAIHPWAFAQPVFDALVAIVFFALGILGLFILQANRREPPLDQSGSPEVTIAGGVLLLSGALWIVASLAWELRGAEPAPGAGLAPIISLCIGFVVLCLPGLEMVLRLSGWRRDSRLVAWLLIAFAVLAIAVDLITSLTPPYGPRPFDTAIAGVLVLLFGRHILAARRRERSIPGPEGAEGLPVEEEVLPAAPAAPVPGESADARGGRSGGDSPLLIMAGGLAATAIAVAFGLWLSSGPARNRGLDDPQDARPRKRDSLIARLVAQIPFTPGGPAPLTVERERALKPGDSFKECAECPEMVVVPAGTFAMGSPADEPGRKPIEGPVHHVDISRPFAVGRYPVTRFQYAAFVGATGPRPGQLCVSVRLATEKDAEQLTYPGAPRTRPGLTLIGESRTGPDGYTFERPGFAQAGDHPGVCISWDDAMTYIAWLNQKTGRSYRLLSEAEREYVARAGTQTEFWWGPDPSPELANYQAEDEWRITGTVSVLRYAPNAFGLYQVYGNVSDWVADCWNDSYAGAPADGSAWLSGDCGDRIVRGGGWLSRPAEIRAAARYQVPQHARSSFFGAIRVARDLAR